MKAIEIIFLRMTTLVLLCVFLIGCKPQQIVVEKVKTEKEYVDRWHYDSIFVSEKAHHDTIYITKEKYKFRHDTIRITQCDSIPYEVQVIKEVNRLSKIQKFFVSLGMISMGIGIGYIILKFIKRK